MTFSFSTPRCDVTSEVRATRRSRTAVGQRRSLASSDAILEAVTHIFEHRGTCSLTIDAIAERARVSKQTIYRWWANKAALTRDVYERADEASVRLPNSGNVEDDLTDYLLSLWSWWASTSGGDVLRSFIADIQSRPAALDEFKQIFLPRRERRIRQIFVCAQARGELADTADVDAAVSLLVGLSWLHLLTDNLHATAMVRPTVRLVVGGMSICEETGAVDFPVC